MESPKLNEKGHKGPAAGSTTASSSSQTGAISKRQASLQNEHSKEEMDASTSQILERVKSDRIAVTKPEEDWRRRTIIVEKKNGSYGFTLQSYGIHYKKEQEIEMITYVDYVEFDGPAYRSGMREGDVILSINGVDMEKADHKTLVNFIKNCDTRMRMVVLFEDCVRKVELHIRYIELQRLLQDKTNELERLCLRERELLDGKWKTHSLPSTRKKTNDNGEDTPLEEDGPNYLYCRPTVSTEDVASKHKHTQVMLTYQYLDPNYRAYVLQPSTSRSGDYVVSLGPPRSRSDHHHFIVKTPCDSQGVSITSRQIHGGFSNQVNGTHQPNAKPAKKGGGHNHSHRCNPCYPPQNNQDSASLEAYDLASPCCDPHCVPSTKRRIRHHKHHDKEHHHHHHHHHRKKDKRTPEKENTKRESSSQTRSKSQSQCQQTQNSVPQNAPRYRYLNFGVGLVSQCSLQSCTSSEVSVTVPTCESSVASYTTSLSTDTLYWDNPNARTPPKIQNLNQHHHQVYQPQYKPKSWDNLTTKAFGGYGFGYGYSDTSSKQGGSNKGHNRAHSTKSNQEHRSSGHRHSANEKQIQHRMYVQHQQHQQHQQQRYTPPTKSTESLLVVSKYHDPTLSDSSVSCECLDVGSPDSTLKSSSGRFFPRNPGNLAMSPTDQRNTGYYSQHIPHPQQGKRCHNIPSTSSEITRL